MRKRKTPTRVKAQDMKTGQFAYLDELVQDGYFPSLWILPENYEPPIPVGTPTILPLDPIVNYSPPNHRDTTTIVLSEQIDTTTGRALMLPTSFCSVGTVTVIVGP